jgi:hypothetical protein
MAKRVWRVKLVTELQAGETTEVEVGRIERDEQACLSDLGLCLEEAKQLTSALQAEIVPAQVTIAGFQQLRLELTLQEPVSRALVHEQRG